MAVQPTQPRAKRRLAPDDRRREIIHGAAAYFADHGFAANTRELASRLNIAQGLLYRYFESKDGLIESVYREVYVSRWNPLWETLLEDGSQPFDVRLREYALAYARTVVERTWIRMLMYASLADLPIAKRYISLLDERIILRLCLALRSHLGLSGVHAQPLLREEKDVAWAFQGSIIYLGVRRYVYGIVDNRPIEESVNDLVSGFLDGAPRTIASLFATRDGTEVTTSK